MKELSLQKEVEKELKAHYEEQYSKVAFQVEEKEEDAVMRSDQEVQTLEYQEEGLLQLILEEQEACQESCIKFTQIIEKVIECFFVFAETDQSSMESYEKLS